MTNTKKKLAELDALMTGYWLTDFSNFSAFFYQNLPKVNWVGFYLNDGDRLRLGPFQGKPACTEIAFNRGVCGAAFSKQEILIVDDVHSFAGHITCDPDSKSELVIPLTIGKKRIGVLDLDSPVIGRFTNEDSQLLQEAVEILLEKNPALEKLSLA